MLSPVFFSITKLNCLFVCYRASYEAMGASRSDLRTDVSAYGSREVQKHGHDRAQ